MDFKNRLRKFEKTFKTAKRRAKEEGTFGNDLPDGKYKACLEECTLGLSKSSDRLQVSFIFTIIAGELKGEKVCKYQSVETEDDQVWLARDLRRFGIEAPDTSEDLEDIVKLLDESKPELTISLNTKDSGQFCYVNKVHTEIDAGEFAAQEGNDDQDITPENDKDPDGPEITLEVGMEVEFETKSGKELTGEITEIDEDEEKAEVETEDGKTYMLDFDNITPVDGGEDQGNKDEVTVEVGMKVEFEDEDGDTIIGTVLKIFEDDGIVKVKDEDGAVYKVDVDKLSIPESAEKPNKPKKNKREAPRKPKKTQKLARSSRRHASDKRVRKHRR